MTKHSIQNVARSHFALYGYEGASLANIAHEVGIKKQSIATYFSTKESLYRSVLNDLIEDYIMQMKSLQERISHGSVKEKLFQALYQSYIYKKNNPIQTTFLHRVIYFSPPALAQTMKEEVIKMEKLSSQMYQSVFEEGIKSGVIKAKPCEDLMALFYCLIDGLALQLFLYDGNECEKRFKAIWEIFWEGIQA